MSYVGCLIFDVGACFVGPTPGPRSHLPGTTILVNQNVDTLEEDLAWMGAYFPSLLPGTILVNQNVDTLEKELAWMEPISHRSFQVPFLVNQNVDTWEEELAWMGAYFPSLLPGTILRSKMVPGRSDGLRERANVFYFAASPQLLKTLSRGGVVYHESKFMLNVKDHD